MIDFQKKCLSLIELSIPSLSILWKSSSVIYIKKPFPENICCFNDFKFEGSLYVFFSIWGLGFCLSLLENNLDFIKVFVI